MRLKVWFHLKSKMILKGKHRFSMLLKEKSVLGLDPFGTDKGNCKFSHTNVTCY